MKLALLIIILGVTIYGCSNTQEPEKEAIRPVYYQTISSDSGMLHRSFAGVSQAQSQAKLSFRVGGTIQKIKVKKGSKVRKGQTLASLNGVDYRIAYTQSVAQKKNAIIQLTVAKANLGRVEQLFANNHVSQSEYEQAKAKYEAALAQSNLVSLAADALYNKLRYTKLIAPFAGTISAVLVQANELTPSGKPVLIISSEEKIEVKLSVPESIIRRIETGDEVDVSFSTLKGIFFAGIVSEVAYASENPALVPIIILIINASDSLCPGMAAKVKFRFDENTQQETPIIITPDAVAHDENGDFVYVLQPSDSANIYLAERRTVELGNLQDVGYEVITGLFHNEKIVEAGINYMYNGQKVSLLKTE